MAKPAKAPPVVTPRSSHAPPANAEVRPMATRVSDEMSVCTGLATPDSLSSIVPKEAAGSTLPPNALEIPMPSSVWTGYLTFGLISMPVRLFSGARGSRISFHMLHRDDMTRIKQQLYCPNDERVVERSEIVKGYEYLKGENVVIEPQRTKNIET